MRPHSATGSQLRCRVPQSTRTEPGARASRSDRQTADLRIRSATAAARRLRPLLPAQSEFLRAWGPWRAMDARDAFGTPRFYAANDEATELAACAAWCMQHVDADPAMQLLVITQEIAQRRGAIERAFLRAAPPGSPPLFEFSLGVPLAENPLARAAHLMLRWLGGQLLETELDWLFSTNYLAATPDESNALGCTHCAAQDSPVRNGRYRRSSPVSHVSIPCHRRGWVACGRHSGNSQPRARAGKARSTGLRLCRRSSTQQAFPPAI